MLDKLVVFVEDRSISNQAVKWTLSLARRLGSRVFAVYVIDTNTMPEGPDREKQLSDTEENAWKILYEIEDAAFEQDIRVSLLLNQGNPLERLLDLCTSYEVQLLVLSSNTGLAPAELVKRSTMPVVFVNELRRCDDQSD